MTLGRDLVHDGGRLVDGVLVVFVPVRLRLGRLGPLSRVGGNELPRDLLPFGELVLEMLLDLDLHHGSLDRPPATLKKCSFPMLRLRRPSYGMEPMLVLCYATLFKRMNKNNDDVRNEGASEMR